MSQIGQSLGLSQVEGAYTPQLNNYVETLQNQINNPNQSFAQKNYEALANKGIQQTTQQMAATHGATVQQKMEGARNYGANQLQDTALNSGVLGMQDMNAKQGLLGNMLMGMNGQDINSQVAQGKNLSGMLTGLGSAAVMGGISKYNSGFFNKNPYGN